MSDSDMKTEYRREDGKVAFNCINTDTGRPTFVSPIYIGGARMGVLYEAASNEQIREAIESEET